MRIEPRPTHFVITIHATQYLECERRASCCVESCVGTPAIASMRGVTRHRCVSHGVQDDCQMRFVRGPLSRGERDGRARGALPTMPPPLHSRAQAVAGRFRHGLALGRHGGRRGRSVETTPASPPTGEGGIEAFPQRMFRIGEIGLRSAINSAANCGTDRRDAHPKHQSHVGDETPAGQIAPVHLFRISSGRAEEVVSRPRPEYPLSARRAASCLPTTMLNVVVGVAQLVRAPGCGPGGRGFESRRSPVLLPGIAAPGVSVQTSLPLRDRSLRRPRLSPTGHAFFKP